VLAAFALSLSSSSVTSSWLLCSVKSWIGTGACCTARSRSPPCWCKVIKINAYI
jgi:hypothetical protein